ncbi:MAG: ABC transporter substrate-binding protein [Duodenibacillus sp.]|nr:ABC transporter substrate-binding protein [Duodenibacillus sp.]
MITRRSLIGAAAGVLLAGSGIVSMPLCAAGVGDDTGDPEAWVMAITNDILDAIRADSSLAAADAQRVQKFVDEKVMPVVDFLRMTRTAVGPKWRQASDAQRTELQKLFREQLIRVYSGALATVKDQSVKLAPNRVKPTKTDAIVRTLLVSPGKPDTRINYRLKKVDGHWRIIDVDVEGIWLVNNYRTQFASVVNQSGIEGLIKSLREKNAEAAGGAAPAQK